MMEPFNFVQQTKLVSPAASAICLMSEMLGYIEAVEIKKKHEGNFDSDDSRYISHLRLRVSKCVDRLSETERKD